MCGCQEKFLWIGWTLWFVLDPHLNLYYKGVEWTLSIGIASWFTGIVVIFLSIKILRIYGTNVLILSIISIFLLLWFISIFTMVLPNPYQLISIWKTTSIELYISFLSWLEGWTICLAFILWIAKKWNDKYGDNRK